jgi:hypothetical protein
MMARLPDKVELEREGIEGDLALLGNALVYLGLIGERLGTAVRIGQQQAILAPAIEDIGRVERLMRQVQVRINVRSVLRTRCPKLEIQ